MITKNAKGFFPKTSTLFFNFDPLPSQHEQGILSDRARPVFQGLTQRQRCKTDRHQRGALKSKEKIGAQCIHRLEQPHDRRIRRRITD